MFSRFQFTIIFVICCFAPINSILILRCCPPGQTLLSISQLCSKFDGKWQPSVYSPKRSRLLKKVPTNFQFLDKMVACTNATWYSDQVVLNDEDGSLIHLKYEITFPPLEFCISPTGFVGCVTEHHHNNTRRFEGKTKKCCPGSTLYSRKASSCVMHNSSSAISKEKYVYSGYPECEQPNEYLEAGKLDVEYSLNGTTLLSTAGTVISKYCVEEVLESGGQEKPSIFVCSEEISKGPATEHDVRHTIYPIGLCVSTMFLMMTLVSGFLLPSSYHALHWKCQMHYVACLLIGNLLLVITQLASNVLRDTIECVGIATAMHFFFLAAFFWLNTMCFNIWLLFRDLLPVILNKRQEMCRLVLYEMYAWGGPLLIVSAGAAMDQWLKEKYPKIVRPNFGAESCWFKGDTEQLVYFFGPVAILLGMNFILFGVTTRELVCGLWKSDVVKSTSERMSMTKLCLKLVIVMGVSWIMDVVSWAIGGPNYIWYVTDFVNALQGVFIFMAVGYQPQGWTAVKNFFFCASSSSRSRGKAYSSMSNVPTSSRPPLETLC